MWRRNKCVCLLLQFIGGGLGYGTIEILYRGYTHISMIIAGGLCLPVLVRISRSGANLMLLSCAGGTYITAVELATGCIVNLWLHLNVWDYSQEAMHLLGQICPKFYILWCSLCAVVMYICRVLRTKSLKLMLFAKTRHTGLGMLADEPYTEPLAGQTNNG